MSLEIVWYCAPIIPLLTRAILCLKFRSEMGDFPSEEEQDREAHRSHILALTGFSFSGLLALAVLEATLRQGFNIAIYCLLLSFLFYMFALNIQGYKSRRWHDHFATALMDGASLSLILSVLSIMQSQASSNWFVPALSLLAILIWLFDHFLRLLFQWQYLTTKKEMRSRE
jgi:hypothetical protein